MAGYVETPLFGATDGVKRQALEDAMKTATLQSAQQRLLGAGNRTAVRPKTAEEAGIRRTDARVEVRRETHPQTGELCIEVAVYSLMKPGAFKRVLLDRRAPTAEVQIAAGACAEDCCEAFGDPFDPSQAAHDAIDKLRALRDS